MKLLRHLALRLVRTQVRFQAQHTHTQLHDSHVQTPSHVNGKAAATLSLLPSCRAPDSLSPLVRGHGDGSPCLLYTDLDLVELLIFGMQLILTLGNRRPSSQAAAARSASCVAPHGLVGLQKHLGIVESSKRLAPRRRRRLRSDVSPASPARPTSPCLLLLLPMVHDPDGLV